jgi:hypothetical protein
MKIIEELRKRKVYNLYEFYGEQPHIWYRPRGDSRSMTVPGWMVSKRGINLADHWLDNESKHFGRFDAPADMRNDSAYKQKAAVLKVAQAWASEKFGVKDWKRDPFDGYGPAEFVTERLRAILAAPEGTNTEDRPDHRHDQEEKTHARAVEAHEKHEFYQRDCDFCLSEVALNSGEIGRRRL